MRLGDRDLTHPSVEKPWQRMSIDNEVSVKQGGSHLEEGERHPTRRRQRPTITQAEDLAPQFDEKRRKGVGT